MKIDDVHDTNSSKVVYKQYLYNSSDTCKNLADRHRYFLIMEPLANL